MINYVYFCGSVITCSESAQEWRIALCKSDHQSVSLGLFVLFHSYQVNVELRANQTAGLGSTSSVGVSLDNVQSANKTRRLLQTQARYQRLENCGPHQSDNGTTHNASATSGKSVDDSRTQRGGSAVSLGKSSEKMQINWIRGETQKPP